MSLRFRKYHGLGNDYLVLLGASEATGPVLSAEAVRRICDRHRGLGADGILEARPSGRADVGLRIWNPDGSQAEKSGNGLRIFARFLHERAGLPAHLSVEVPSGVVQAHVEPVGRGPRQVTVEMGRYSTEAAQVPVVEALVDAPVRVGDHTLRLTAVGLGNPHCVAWFDEHEDLDRLPWREWGAALEVDPRFPNRTNVQFARVVERSAAGGQVEVRIWERGAGETSASGSSACAVAASGVLLGRVGPQVELDMPGGRLSVSVGPDRSLVLRGPVEEVGVYELSEELRAALG